MAYQKKIYSADEISEEYHLDLIETKVEKHYEGEASTYQWGPKRYYFLGVFRFHTGSVVKIVLTESRKAYEALETIDVSNSETLRAKKEAFEEFIRVREKVRSEEFAYARSRNYGITLYKRDPESPTGVSAFGGASSMALIEFCKPGAAVLSPTEGLRSNGFRY